jgi:hypothetical protein
MRVMLGRLWKLIAISVAPFALFVAAAPAQAQTMNVACSVPALVNAVEAAASLDPVTINLAAGCTYLFTTPNDDTLGGESALAIDSNTADITINGNGATLARSAAAGTPSFRLLAIGNEQAATSSITIDDLTVENGIATGNVNGAPGPQGGGIAIDAGTLNLDGDTFLDNGTAGSGGGVESFATATVSDSTFLNNVAGGNSETGGGGAYLPGLDNITDSTFSGNSATSGGALSLDAGGVLTNDTMVGNHASGNAGALEVADNGDDFDLNNDTIADNTAPAANGSAIAGIAAFTKATGSIIEGTCNAGPGTVGIISGGYDVIPNGSCGTTGAAAGSDVTDVASADLGALQDNGGPTETEAIGAGSPAFELVPAADCPATDQRGVTRPQPSGAAFCNAGAYETQAVPTMVAYTGPTSAEDATPVTLSATLTQPQLAIGLPAAAGTGIAGQEVTIGFGAESCTAITDASGQASCAVTPSDPPTADPYPVTVTYAGGSDGVGSDAYLGASDSSQSLTVNAAPASTGSGPSTGPGQSTGSGPSTGSSSSTGSGPPTAPAPSTGSTPSNASTPAGPAPTLVKPTSTSLVAAVANASGLKATLTNAKTRRSIAGQALVFKVGRTLICRATTNARGVATCAKLRALVNVALHLSYTVSYAGSTDYQRSTATGSARELALKLCGLRPTSGSDGKSATRRLQQRLHSLGVAKLEQRIRSLRRS